MNVIEIVALGVAGLTTAVKVVTVNAQFWKKIPVLAHYLPGAVVAATVAIENLAGVATESDLVNAGAALALLVYGHFSKPKAPAAPTA